MKYKPARDKNKNLGGYLVSLLETLLEGCTYAYTNDKINARKSLEKAKEICEEIRKIEV